MDILKNPVIKSIALGQLNKIFDQDNDVKAIVISRDINNEIQFDLIDKTIKDTQDERDYYKTLYINLKNKIENE